MKKLLIIKTDEGEKTLSLLNREQVSYQVVYNDDLDKGLTEEEIYRRDMPVRMMNEIEIKPKFGEVYKCTFYDETVGTEIKGARPVLIISTK
ncbi:16277_t:CDS:2 [Funneliformis geosporum]|nr:16277_t:CDS:2 [Funneliformis geosporum]